MAINLKFDLSGNPEPPTIILANRSGNKLGQLQVDESSIDISDKFNDASEFSFTVNKYIDGKITNLWDKIVDFKLVYCKEWNMWFEATVELDEETETVKTVLCTQLGQAELSQINIYNLEINNENDINWDVTKAVNSDFKYKATVLYNPDDPKTSLLHRMLEKAPHYYVEHVDSTIVNEQRAFSFDGTSIYDAFQEVSEEIGCLFVYHSNSDENGNINRAISVYDLWQYCNDCKHRGEFTDECPKCDSTNIKNGYGEDTLIFVTSDELANSGIQLSTDTDSVKNCFKLKAGDDLMTATVRNCNPNGTDYIWYFSEEMKEDMPDELVDALKKYDAKYKDTYNAKINIDSEWIDKYNAIIEKYKDYYNANSSTCLNCGHVGNFGDICPECESNNILHKNKLQAIENPIVGYPALMNAYYGTIDLGLYLESALMPNVSMEDTDVYKEVEKLTSLALSPVAVADVTKASQATVNSAVLAMAKTLIRPTYKVVIKTANDLNTEGNGVTWSGSFEVTNYSNDENVAVSDIITVEVNDDLETFSKQKIDKMLNKEDTDDYSITGLFKKEIIIDGHTDKDGNWIYGDCKCDFCAELKKYALNPLTSFHDACQSCIDILISEGIGNQSSSQQNEDADLYEKLYSPYYNKLRAIEAEMAVREYELSEIIGVRDADNELVEKGFQNIIEDERNYIQDGLNFEKNLDSELWMIFCAYRREDEYSNDNYISDGLDNAKLFERALKFFEVAENDIYKSAELQHSISTSLKNLLAIPKFKPLINYFKLGNWIRVQVDEKIYKLRLIEYGIDFGGFEDISVEFSDVTKIKNGITDVENILSQASSMASSYGTVQRQATHGENSSAVLNNWIENGLDATNTKIVGSYDESLLFDKSGFWCREYDSITDTYSDEQIKILGSTIAITDDNWASTKTAIGKYYYEDPETGQLTTAYGVNGETIVGKLLIGEQLDISNENGSLEFGANGFVVDNDKNTVTINPNDESIFNISNNSGNIFSLNEKGELVIVGNITASSLTLLDGTTIEGGNITGLADVAISGDYDDLRNKPTNVSSFSNDVGYLKNSDLSNAINNALTQAKESGEFDGRDGEDGVSATHSWNGTVLTVTSASGTSSANLKGEKGDLPVRGEDYWTETDKSEIVNAVITELRNQGLI